jgi:hypothetical protein
MSDTMPTTPADTTGAQGPEAAAAAAAASSPANPVAAGSASATTGTSVFSGLQIPGGTLSANAPSGWADKTISTTYTSADIGRLSDLVKLVSAVSTGHPLDGFNAEVIQNVAKNAGLSPQATAALRSGAASKENTQAAVKAAWSGITDQLLALGIAPSALKQKGINTPPNSANAINKLKEVVSLPLESTTLNQLADQGVDAGKIKNVDSLITGHDQGTVQLPGQKAPTTLEAQYDQFVSNWNNNDNNFRQTTVQDLVGMGALDITGGQPTLDQVTQAYQNVMLYASDNNMTVPQAFGDLEGTEPKGNVPGENINAENIDQAYVMHLADEWLGPNQITPYQAQTLANLANKAGTDSDAAEDLLEAGITSLYNPQNPSIDGGSLAGEALAAVNDSLAQWGIPSTPELSGKLVAQVLQGGAVTSPYTVSTLAQTAAENYAKANVQSLYGEGVAQAAIAGTPVAQQAQPYLSTASSILGTPTTEMQVNDPSGIWMKWATGGTGPGGTQTAQEWQNTLMTDPVYKYQNTQEAGALEGGAADSILQLVGKLPSQAAPIPTAPVQAGSPVQG